MINRSLRLLLCSGGAVLLYCWSFLALADELPIINNTFAQGNVCTKIEGRLERLKCFDQIFNTPIEYAQENVETVVTQRKSAVWKRAIAGESTRKNKQGFNLTYADADNDNENTNMWLTVTSKGAYHSDPSSLELLSTPLSKKIAHTKRLPILMLSCLDNISRVEIVLPNGIKSARMRITIPGDPVLTQTWNSDDAGFVVRSGRGIPAIEIMKTMLSSVQLVIRSDSAELDGLYFDTTDLSQSIKPLRKACRW